MNYLKAFIAGIVLPSILLPFFLCIALALKRPQVLTIVFIHFIPLIWGIWNVLYFAFFKQLIAGNLSLRLLLTGGILGLLVAIYGIFGLNIPVIIRLPNSLFYLPLILAPILYAILWRFVVKPLNDLLNLKE